MLLNCQVFWIVHTKRTLINKIKINFGKHKERALMSCICLDSMTFLVKKNTDLHRYFEIGPLCNPEDQGRIYGPPFGPTALFSINFFSCWLFFKSLMQFLYFRSEMTQNATFHTSIFKNFSGMTPRHLSSWQNKFNIYSTWPLLTNSCNRAC